MKYNVFSIRLYYLLLSVLFFAGLLYGCGKVTPEQDPDTVIDIDGNIYRTVKIGSQTWMAENLRTTRYRNGDSIDYAPDSAEWNREAGAFCSYENSSVNISTFGLLYNWFAVNDNRSIAPAGWHVPALDEWLVLIDYIGGDSVAGGRLKEKGSNHWLSPNVGANDQYAFTALPAGWRWGHGPFIEKGLCAIWWTSTDVTEVSEFTYAIDIYNQNGAIDHGYLRQKSSGFSVRCVKD